VSLPHVTATFGSSYPLPAPATSVRFGNTALSAPHVTEVVDLFGAVVVLVAAAAVDLVELVVAGVLGVSGAGAEVESGVEIDESAAREVDVVVESAVEEEPQADKSPSPRRARQEKRGFCISLLDTIYSPPLGIPAILTGGQVVALAVSTVEC